MQNEFPDDLTLKLNTAFVSIQTGQHELGLNLLDELAESDPRNRRQYHQLMLQFAIHTGDPRKARALITKLLNAPVGAHELYRFSQKLHQNGFTQYAIAAAQKAVPLAMEQRDPHFLIELSGYLENWGADWMQRVSRNAPCSSPTNPPGTVIRCLGGTSSGRQIWWGHSKIVKEREPKLVEATQKNPDSFQAHKRLAAFYESTNQLKKASVALEAALALRPKDRVTRQRYAQVLEQSRRFSDAVDQYVVLLKENPNALSYNFSPIINTFLQAGEVDKLVSLAKEAMVPAIGPGVPNPFCAGGRPAVYAATFTQSGG